MIRLVVADDHPIVRDGLARLLEGEPDMTVVATCADGADLFDALAASPCDVLVVDLSLPHLGGLELVRGVAERHPGLPMIVFTMRPEDALALHIVRAGAAAYLCKDRSGEELLEAIRTVDQGRIYLTDRLRDLAAASSLEQLPHAQLSARQYQVFQLLIAGRTVNDVAGVLEISASTTSNHVAEIRRKLGVETVGEILIYAHRAGLLG